MKSASYISRKRKEMALAHLNKETSTKNHAAEIGAVGGTAIVLFITICLVLVKLFENWLDKSQVVGIIITMASLAGFAYWALIGRKK